MTMSTVTAIEELAPSALVPYSAGAFYPAARNYMPQLDASSMPIIPIAAAANPSKMLQPVVRTVGKHGGLSLLSRTPEEIALRSSIDQMVPHLNEKYAARIRSQLRNAETYVKGKKEGQDKPISMKNLVKISMHARQLLARQIKVQAGAAERESRKAKNSVVSHSRGAYHSDGTKILGKGAAQRAYGRAKRARVKQVTAAMLRGEGLQGLAANGAALVGQAVRKRYVSKIRKERGVGSQIIESAAGEAAVDNDYRAQTGESIAPPRRTLAKGSPAAAAAASSSMQI